MLTKSRQATKKKMMIRVIRMTRRLKYNACTLKTINAVMLIQLRQVCIARSLIEKIQCALTNGVN